MHRWQWSAGVDGWEFDTLASTKALKMPQSFDRTMPESTPVSFDPYGQAALLLVESLIHGLCEKAVISNDEAIEIVERAVNVQLDRVDAVDGAAAHGWHAHALLLKIMASLQIDGHRPGLSQPLA